MNCIFCKIINNEIPSYTIYEDEIVKVFLDINPSVNGHMLIIPKKHFLDITDIDNEILAHMVMIEKRMFSLLKKSFQVDGVTFVQNNGCSQEVKHFHIHVIPRCLNENILEPQYINHDKITLDEAFTQLISNL